MAANGSICIVANELAGLGASGGIGTSNGNLAHLLAERGWRVHLLYVPFANPQAVQAFRETLPPGIGLSTLDEFPTPVHVTAPGWPSLGEVEAGERVRVALECLHRDHAFDLVKFSDWRGHGFRALQAKKAGLAFDDLGFVVVTHGMSHWARNGAGVWPGSPNDLLLDHCEQWTFEQADFQVSPTRHLLDYARRIGWRVRDDVRIVPNVFPNTTPPTLPPVDSIELVFFGRLETRKGLELFLGALDRLDHPVPVTFLGPDTHLADGTQASDLIRRRMGDRPVRLEMGHDRRSAIRYLCSGNRVAVIPSLLDNFPNTVVECGVHGVPFLASNVGGIPEILPDPELRARLLFDPTPASLARRLREYLYATTAQRLEWRDRTSKWFDPIPNRDAVAACYAECRDQVRRGRTRVVAVPVAEPLVTVAVTHHDLGAYLPETLAALDRQTHANLEVLVLDDGSTDAASRRVFTEQRALYPRFRFLDQANTGLCKARNRLLREARGEFFIPVDADDLPRPCLVERLTRALVRNPEAVAMACYYFYFVEADDLIRQIPRGVYRPTGGPRILGPLWNVWGATSALYRTSVLRSLGGYDQSPDNVSDDWELMSRLAALGHTVGVVPEPLLDYRVRPDSMSRTIDLRLGQRFVLERALSRASTSSPERESLWRLLLGTLEARSRAESDARQGQVDILRARAECEQARADRERVQGEWEQARGELDRVRQECLRVRAERNAIEARLALKRHRLAERVNALLARCGPAHAALRLLYQAGGRGWRMLRSPRKAG